MEGVDDMKIEYVHGSKYGNGAEVAEEFKARMARRNVEVAVHHVHGITAATLPPADLYVFSSPGRMGRPIRSIHRFLKELALPAGTRYALLTTEMEPKPDKATGQMPTEEEICRYQHVRPNMNEVLQDKGMVEVAEEKVYVTGMKGPLEDGWRDKVGAFADRLLALTAVAACLIG